MARPSRQRSPRISRLRTSIRNRISPLLHALAGKWLQFCETRRTLSIKGVLERDPATLSAHEFYGPLKGVKYYDLQTAYNEGFQEGPLAPGCALDERLKKAIATYNCCMWACVGLWDHLHKVLGDDPDYIEIKAMEVYVWPRLVLFPPGEKHGEEGYVAHTYMVIKFRCGISFIFDPTGYQFGFSKILYSLGEYEVDILNPFWQQPREYDVEAQIRFNKEVMAYEDIDLARPTFDGMKTRKPGPLMQDIAFQLLGFASQL
ncbi:hypothetical protein FB567DRAFT_633722 [Paraphoma chrysanthemicola]|uniref:Uncharacterized protein n=1 Tax=Paraphoma chrysanthemicola TaxID=798071 RepID=A0A8K0VS97_9PLEO|nr:hypothetical protein FB567DRAFT_633722 [Paraphoma chrysanthemicola]